MSLNRVQRYNDRIQAENFGVRTFGTAGDVTLHVQEHEENPFDIRILDYADTIIFLENDTAQVTTPLLELDNITSLTTLVQVESIGMYSIIIAPSLNETLNIEITIQWIIPQGFLFVPGLFAGVAGVLLIFFTDLVWLLKIPASDVDGENA
jgi:hypothetical protein